MGRFPNMTARAAILPLLFAVCGCGSSVVSEMTLDEKVHMLVGTHDERSFAPAPAPGTHREAPVYSQEKILGNTAYSEGRVRGAAGDGYGVPRLGVPSIVYADGPAGLRISEATTAFPTSSLLSSTWDIDLVRKVGRAMGGEVLEFGADILLAPGMNIHRNPLCGRNYEYFSEDPFLTGKMAAAFVSGVQSRGVGTSVKHFAVNSQEFYRNGIDSRLDARTLREIYLRGFEIAVREAHPWTVMTSYNRICGTFASECEWLLRDILRDEWGFDGFVMTDWWGADDPLAQMKAGNNLLMPGSPVQVAEIKDAVLAGKLDESVLDRNVEDMLRVIERSPVARGYRYSNSPDFDSNAEICRRAAADGMVLLENNGVLPLAPCRAALFGCYSYDTQIGGSGSGFVTRRYKISIAQGLADAGFTIDAPLENSYNSHISTYKADKGEEGPWNVPIAPEISLSERSIAAAASRNDVAFFTIGRMAGEDGDRSPVKGDYYLSEIELTALNRVCDCFHSAGKKVVCLVNAGAAIGMDGWQNLPDALLYVWMPGQEGGHAVADIVTGSVCPSGKLPDTFAARYEDFPSSANFGLSEGETNAVRYEEALAVGYRGAEGLYPFGYGLSYTSFEYSGLRESGRQKDGSIEFSLTVTNTGNVEGRESVQIYVSKPSLLPGRPEKELCAFAKTSPLKPGRSETLRITVPAYELLQFLPAADPKHPADGKWELAIGDYRFLALPNSASAPLPDCELTISL